MAELETAFVIATQLYNSIVLDAVGNARAANVQQCFYDDTYVLPGVKKWPDSGRYSFNDWDPSWATDPSNPWAGRVHDVDFSVQGREACNNTRNVHVARVVAKVRGAQMQKLWAAEQVFVQRAKDSRAITITSARYGTVNDITGYVGFACQGSAHARTRSTTSNSATSSPMCKSRCSSATRAVQAPPRRRSHRWRGRRLDRFALVPSGDRKSELVARIPGCWRKAKRCMDAATAHRRRNMTSCRPAGGFEARAGGSATRS